MKRSLIVFAVGVFAMGLSGCLSMQNQPSLDALQQSGGNSQSAHPYVEAFVEYRGPQEKWAGPTTFMLHVIAKDAGIAKISVMPALFGTAPKLVPGEDGATHARTPASVDVKSGGMAGETARTHMNMMAAALQGGEETYRGCLSPVKVRLIRTDGAVLEKQGCRGQMGWPKAASEAVNQFILHSLSGS